MKLRAENIVKKYRSRTVVKDVSLELNQGRNSRSFRSERSRENNIFLYDCRADKGKWW